MALRKAATYSKHKKKPYTRKSNVKSKAYVKAIPSTVIVKFVMGDVKRFLQKKFNYTVNLLASEPVLIRDNAIESARNLIHKELESEFKGNYYFCIALYPHHVIRENKLIAGAGADRMQSGMKESFGTPIGIGARVKEGKEIFKVAVSGRNDISKVIKILKKTKAKLPCKSKIQVEEIKK